MHRREGLPFFKYLIAIGQTNYLLTRFKSHNYCLWLGQMVCKLSGDVLEGLLNGSRQLYEEAKKYIQLGVPVGPATDKAIKILEWPKLSGEDFLSEKYVSYWRQATGIGLVCGKTSGVICLDLDLDIEKDAALIAEITAKLPPILSGKQGNPKRPPARFFRYSGEENKKLTALSVEILSTGNQTIIPPSKHPSGCSYVWVGQPLYTLDVDDLPYLPRGFIAWLDAKNEEIKNKSKTSNDKEPRAAEGRCVHNSHNIISRLALALVMQRVPFDIVMKRIIEEDRKLNHDSDFLYFLCPSRKWKKKSVTENASDFLEDMFKRHQDELAGDAAYEEKPKEAKSGIVLRTLKDLLDSPEEKTPFIVDNLLPSGGTSIVVAKPKVGKTTLLRQMALSISRGRIFLDRYTSQGPVIYFSVEEKVNEIRSHFKAMGADGSEPIYIFADRAPRDTIEQLAPIIKEIKPALLILDTLFKIIRVKDTNDYAAVSNALEPIQEIARNTGTHIMGVHHAGKGEREGADGILGSTAIFGAFDTAIILGRSGNKRTIKSIQRYGSDLETSALLYDKATRSSMLGPEDWKVKADERADEVLSFIRKAGRPATSAEIKEATGMDKEVLSRTLKSMVSSGKINVRGLGVRGDPNLYSIGVL